MSDKKAKLFRNGRSQAVRLPAEFRFDGDEVYIRRDADTGEVVLSAVPSSWDGFFAVRDAAKEEARGFLTDRRDPPAEQRPFLDEPPVRYRRRTRRSK